LAAAAATSATAGLIDHGSATAAAAALGSAMGGVAGNYATDLFKVLHRPVAERWLEGRSGIDENHTVASALRLAQIKALGIVRDRFDTTWIPSDDTLSRYGSSCFSYALKDFLEAETKTAEQAGFDMDPNRTADEKALRDAVLEELPDLFDESLAARRAAEDQTAIQESLAQVRAALEKAVLAEVCLRTTTSIENVPGAFLSAFNGSDYPESWFDLFVRDAAFRLKENPSFERVWGAEQLALVKAIAEASRVALARIEKRQTEHTEMLQELLVLARTGGAFQRAAAQGIPEPAVRAIVDRLGGEGITAADLIPWLDNWIEAARQQLGRSANEGEAFEAARQEAERRFKAGRLGDASAAFMDELVREERLETERQIERKRHRIRLLEEAIRYDELAFNPAAAVAKLRMIADIEDIAGPDALGAWLHVKAGEFYERGRDKGINAALALAIATYGAALEERTRERVPLDWAATQMNLGNALVTLGERESGTTRLEEAVAGYRAALEELTRERVPLDWALTQMNLGNALATLGERESGTTRLEEAVAAYRAALEERTRERVPLDWAATQMNLGNALAMLGERESGTTRLEEAVAAYRAALATFVGAGADYYVGLCRENLHKAQAALAERAE
jgi:tetratricopeptide (TPR) repeat protein